jgi:hypothetical protein
MVSRRTVSPTTPGDSQRCDAVFTVLTRPFRLCKVSDIGDGSCECRTRLIAHLDEVGLDDAILHPVQSNYW